MDKNINDMVPVQMLYVNHPKNIKGRDFIVADLHGCYSEFMRALERVNFDSTYDRVFSVGDLIDRGPESYSCLQLLKHPWFFAVLGNHEAMLLQFLRIRENCKTSRYDFLYNGGSWFEALSQDEQSAVMSLALEKVSALPLVRCIDHAVRPFNIVHAQLWYRDDFLTLQDLERPYGEGVCTWGRNLIMGQMESLGEGIALEVDCPIGIDALLITPVFSEGQRFTYAGHTIVDRPVLTRSHFFIDCGSYLLQEQLSGAGTEFPIQVVPLYEHDEVCRWIERMVEVRR